MPRNYIYFHQRNYYLQKEWGQPIRNVLLQRTITETTGRSIIWSFPAADFHVSYPHINVASQPLILSNYSEESDYVIGTHTSTSRPRFGNVWVSSLLATIPGDPEETRMMLKEPRPRVTISATKHPRGFAGINVCRDIVKLHKVLMRYLDSRIMK